MACDFHHVVKYTANADEFISYPIEHEMARMLDNATRSPRAVATIP